VNVKIWFSAVFSAIMAIGLTTTGIAAAEGELQITSKKLEVDRKQDITVFSGNVIAVKSSTTITADVLENYAKNGKVVAAGNVKSVDFSEKERIDMRCGKAEYDEKMSYSILTGNPVVTRTKRDGTEEKVEISGKKMEIYREKKEGVVTGNVLIKQEEILGKSELLRYYSDMKKIVLTGGGPTIECYEAGELSAAYSAEVVTIYSDQNRVIFENAFNADIYP